mmetsp:Transcript_30479/g.46678  ORF Transcript_30479/g.46678 Transcript_30479/m.46678 type:complete len:1009 (-) Transcript_30479:399-3425(-)|eukprot:CAMPEP_0118712912 /NCGR_PEP_ID=MMETSP0800-20121206/25158_1 /TAXON_ID=210618 ORGANISM="Striatella unipunctata, Strain CCMP2910" /NCGR_SAMPLE_ID=MMETSP0800 /ASSEMBLY_ACC=CAM_ASM_000638 /LENGTH=1008 /DNA_ID=CAMNT_0006618173 /DNA_START=153 /DNA_END=3179 /DNA_ORIENTATION=+
MGNQESLTQPSEVFPDAEDIRTIPCKTSTRQQQSSGTESSVENTGPSDDVHSIIKSTDSGSEDQAAVPNESERKQEEDCPISLKRIETRLLQLLGSTKDQQILLHDLLDEYCKEFSEGLNPKVHGYEKLTELLADCQNIVVYERPIDRNLFVKIGGSNEVLDQQNAREGKEDLSIARSAVMENHVNKKRDCDTNIDTESSKAEAMVDNQGRPLAAECIHRRFLQLLDSSPEKKILLSHIPQEYHTEFSEVLDTKALGYKKLKDLISECPGVDIAGPTASGKEVLIQNPNWDPPLWEVERRLLTLIDSSPDGRIALAALPFQYKTTFSSSLQYNKYGKKRLKDLLQTFSSLAIPPRPCGQEVLMRSKPILERHQQDNSTSSETNTDAPNSQNDAQKNKTIKYDSDNVGTNESTKARDETLLISTIEQLYQARNTLENAFRQRNTDSFGSRVLAIDCEGVPENLLLIQVCHKNQANGAFIVHIFDCVKINPTVVCTVLSPLLRDQTITKLFHDLHKDAVAIADLGEERQLGGTFDTQLAMEHITGDMLVGFNAMLKQLEQGEHPLKKEFRQNMASGSFNLFATRPLTPAAIEYASLDVSLLLKAANPLLQKLGPEVFKSIQRASDQRAALSIACGGRRTICFDVGNSYALASYELLHETRPDDVLVGRQLEVSNDTSVLLDMLPEDLACDLSHDSNFISDISLDRGRRPLAWVDGQRQFLGNEGRIIKNGDIAAIVEKIGGFGTDNRAGFEGQLHRISAIRNRQSDIIGLTMRVGRHVNGNASMISDLLFQDSSKSILFMGEPGSGKTTVIREVTRLLAETNNVFIVDTSNEIAGDGDVPHPCVGHARRMMVPKLDKQGSVMIECVQNHTPHLMVIDEIGRPAEVESARTCKQRGVRLVASAHGDLRKLIKNPRLRGLVGGVETVILGDAEAAKNKSTNGGGLQKLKAQRAGAPTFDIIVELRRGVHHEWKIIMDVAEAIDTLLEGRMYPVQRRTRDPESGSLQLHLERG